jgi:drug/metabolite transporter superfamily protein YnfA
LENPLRQSALYAFFLVAAVLEVAGDAVIRRGLRGSGLLLIALGFVMLGTYGIAVNLVPMDFSRLLGVYVAVFATTGVLFGRFLFCETVAPSTWAGLAIIILGGLVIQFGPAVWRYIVPGV